MSRPVTVPFSEDGRNITSHRWYRVLYIPGHQTPLEEEAHAFDAAHPEIQALFDPVFAWALGYAIYCDLRRRLRAPWEKR